MEGPSVRGVNRRMYFHSIRADSGVGGKKRGRKNEEMENGHINDADPFR